MAQKRRWSAASQHSQSMTQEENDDPTVTQPSMSQVQRALEKIPPAQIDQKVAEVVKYFLVKDQKKVPMRRADLVKHVVKEYRNILPEIMKRAAHTFDQVFGLTLVEIDTKNHVYILINKLDTTEGSSPVTSPANPKRGLLFIILSIIFMKGGFARETLIWDMLKKMRVDPGENHAELGDIKKLVTDEFVRQRYLDYVKILHSEPSEYEFQWGQRADSEVSKAKILEFMAQLYGKDPQSWTQQYREAHSSQDSSQPSTSSQR